MDESLITPALQARIGVPSEPVIVEVTPLLVGRVREMLGELSAAGDDRVPPAVLNMPDGGREIAPLPHLPPHSLLTGDEWELRRPIRLGETLTAVNRLADANERLSGRLGHALMLRHEWTFTDAAGDTVAFARRSIAHYAQERVRPRDEPPPLPGGLPLEAAAGAGPRTAREGDPIVSTLFTPTFEQVIRYIAIAWNFVPIFYDAEAARAAGLP
ncbi:MAG: FAS1-like dehydratase domain-containing protein, partial [Dehalococcoidia bacterium]